MPNPPYIQWSITYGVRVVFFNNPVNIARAGSMDATDQPFTHFALNREDSSKRILLNTLSKFCALI
jgi:hypothetical protein